MENISQLSSIEEAAGSESVHSLANSSKKSIKLIYCSDGVVEECEEDIEEAKRIEKAAQEKQLEEQRRLDIEAKTLPWIPWMSYMAKRTAVRTLEACDFAGEKLAWWFGITKPKYLYEINEYEAMMREQEQRAKEEDPTEEIIVGAVSMNKSFDAEQQNELNGHYSQPVDPADAELRLYEHNEISKNSSPLKQKPLLQS